MSQSPLIPQLDEKPYFPEFGEITARTISPYLIPGLLKFKEPFDKKSKAEKILQLICSYEEIEIDLVKSKTRKRAIVNVRHMACSLIRWAVADITLNDIGQLMGGRDHATALHSIKQCKDYHNTERNWRNRYDYLKGLLITHGYAKAEY